jgi:hypothetical protein
MKSYATFFIIAVMSASLLFLLFTRNRPNHDAPAEVLVAPDADGGADAGADASSVEAGVAAAADGGAKAAPGLVRVAALGWDLVAAGAAMTPADGGAPAHGPPVELAPEPSLDAIEARLARGGADLLGADVAVLPLPAFVGAYEKLRALDPRVFLVVGFSHGREEIHAAPGALLKPPPGADEVKMIAGGVSDNGVGMYTL